MDVRVRLLGGFELTCDGDVAIDAGWKPAKAAAIVKILALREGRSMLREQLIAALWPEADADAGANSLYKNLHQLRKTVRRAGGPRDVIHLDHPLIALAPYVRVDLDELRRRAASIGATATPEELEHAVADAGPLLPDDIYEPWTEPYRGNVHMQITRLRLQLARMYVDAQSYERAIEQYDAVLRLDDLCDEAHHGLMRAYIGCERRDLALRQYERYRAVLASELGTAPSAETEALVAGIRREGAKSRAAEAVDEAVRDADDAMRRRAYSDAVRLYR